MSTNKRKNDVERPNEVRVLGAVSGDPETRVLPSGDELCVFRVVVPRVPVRARSDGRRGPSVDVVDCCAWDARTRRSVSAWRPGDEVEIHGALRRRFFRAGGATVSRVEVEVSSARLLRRAAIG